MSTKSHPKRGHFVDIFVHEMSPKVSTKCHPFCPRDVTYYVHKMSATPMSLPHLTYLWFFSQATLASDVAQGCRFPASVNTIRNWETRFTHWRLCLQAVAVGTRCGGYLHCRKKPNWKNICEFTYCLYLFLQKLLHNTLLIQVAGCKKQFKSLLK